ncbi:sugar phosphate isomerase/epimerase family protein [Streptomyces sp. OK228]|uniref:sugar phosphate isomerase/epimerase family protein n=1 Tax=Streptomyces sp. OK228 TaxID=1882786 RepID=UPI001C53A020|nr:TIM barrel protein [Streptomyces sp. OK228]
MPPVAFVALAADLGCRYISTALTSNPYNPSIYPPFSLRDDPTLRREMIAAMRDRDVSISLGEGMVVREGADIQDRVGDLEIMAELGVRRINTVSLDPDLDRSIDQFGILAENAASLGMETTVEASPGLTVPDLPSALDVVRQVGRPDFRLLVDTMHIVRSGSGPDDLARLDPGVIGYIQLSDAPLVPAIPTTWKRRCSSGWCPGRANCPCWTCSRYYRATLSSALRYRSARRRWRASAHMSGSVGASMPPAVSWLDWPTGPIRPEPAACEAPGWNGRA